MIRYAAVPIIAILGACSAEVENSQAEDANRIETLSVSNLVITGANTASGSSAPEAEVLPPSQPAQTSTPVTKSRTDETPAEPKQQAARKPSTEAAAKPTSQPESAAARESKAEPETPASTCTPEHRAMGHC